MKWEDLTVDSLHVCRPVVLGKVDATKTELSVRDIPLIEPLRGLLEMWREQCGNPAKGWIFENERGRPLDLSNTVDRVIRPTIEARGLRWKGLYGGRRGFGTALVELTEAWSPHKRGLGHTNMATTVKHYKKLTQNGLADGMRLLEAAATSDQK